MYKNIDDIRQEFLSFFKKRGHEIVSSSTLVPNSDQTLLFTNSGMNQFKNIFLGIDHPLFKRVATAQRCVRAGGKHNDLDNVGYTEWHLTFFEMLGNFSFGDYFKHEAIQLAWELLTNVNWFNLSKNKLWVTVHICDDESYDIWSKKIDIPNEHIVRIGNNTNDFCDSDNFWKMGNIGPCGPCSEIFYDRGDQFPGGPPGSVETFGERYVEIWNLVFIQFNRQENGHLLSLPMLSVDTGMGLERITSILQGVNSAYSIDVFKKLISSISRIMKINDIHANRSVYVIADHIRTCSFLIQDGILPSNEGRGYVLRRIIRRAILHGRKLGINDIFFYKLVPPLIKAMHHIANILHEKKDFIEKILLSEEKLFKNTLKRGLELLEKQLIRLQGNCLHGEIAFHLYDTYGFPLELTQDVCLKHGIHIDQIGFDQAMLTQKKRTKESNKFDITYEKLSLYNVSSIFVGHDKLNCKARVIALFQKNKSINKIDTEEEGIVILNNTPFYGESGGQIGDCGQLNTKSGFFQVTNTKKYGHTIAHLGMVNNGGTISVGEEIVAQVDQHKRKCISLNHSATHLLHAALFQVIGSHVMQKGSLVNDRYLRFDFYHHEKMTTMQINTVENIVNQQIWKNSPITVDVMPIEVARDNGAVILTNKKYDKKVRVLRIGSFSIELCGGTHAARTGEIGVFVITKYFSIASGIKRIEAVTSNVALSVIHQHKMLLKNIFQLTQSDDKNILSKIHEFKYRYQKLEKEIDCLRNQQNIQQSLSFIKNTYYIKDVPVLIKQVVNLTPKTLLKMIDCIKHQLKSGVIILININENNKTNLVTAVTKDLIERNRIDALSLVRCIINALGGKGGGRPDFAQAGINNITTTSKVSIAVDSLLHKIL
ncbi:alanine--tRNA ligase [Blochmannia endosymbiont of Camponotus sp. C-003]|uniref:alanine--tRNA ligase n=1 Tax=unclassified Candidatus Blochmanniella TaxID=711328 RepID=UPI002023EF67|nr:MULTISPECIES: alanine--tRNA ligase [unclassified Candidatus Blochmannia]URJ23075.1 alanine--tRNA ligase [Blochmannia endosymbiont of Camponotus sp. C-003]URJ28542.1 alanine--tRNA ligase [Blochmannia endosymbiont of Camponotus sp. C-046]